MSEKGESVDAIVAMIPGSREVIDHFGRWPSFHDAEVLAIHLDRSSASYIRIHTFTQTSKLTPSGQFVTTDHAVVCFWMEGITTLELHDFNQQNVISGLDLTHEDDAFRLVMVGCYGIQGSVSAHSIRVSLDRGIPKDSVYSTP